MMQIAEQLLENALQVHAMDILLLPFGTLYRVKFFIIDQYVEQGELSVEEAQKIITFFKFKADMALSEHRRPQLGAWMYQQKVYLRFSTVGDFLGRESLVIRLIYPLMENKINYLVKEQQSIFQTACQNKGLILFSGPMGSGKTSAMYQLVKSLAKKQVMCIEDPIEIQEPEFLQIQVNDKVGMDYTTLLKAALRHHPDIFIIGEIRDLATAKAAITATLSGHLVLSTVHAPGVYAVVERLLNLGVNKLELQQVLQLVSYQRLLPLINGERGVLFDILSGEKLFEKVVTSDLQQMTNKWREELEKCLHARQITAQTFQHFLKG